MRVFTSFILLFLAAATGVQAQDKDFGSYFKILNMADATVIKSQDLTGTCWSFSTTSFLESELLRLGRGEWDLSEMYVVRMIYMDKAEQYVRFQGKANFSQGSLGHDLLRVYRDYGMMPESAYSGYNGKEQHNHSIMEKSMKNYLDSIIGSGKIHPGWQDRIISIMDSVMGPVPETFEVNGHTYTPRSFADELLKLNVDDYAGFTSFIHQPFDECVVVQVPDNYSRGEYINIELSQMMKLMKHVLENGHTIEWDGDVSGGGFSPLAGVAVYAGDSVKFSSVKKKPEDKHYSSEKRQDEFDSYITTDDHLMHITGLAQGEDGQLYFITKNSWGEKASFSGYMMMSEAYTAMKTVCIIIHKDAIPESLKSNMNGYCEWP